MRKLMLRGRRQTGHSTEAESQGWEWRTMCWEPSTPLEMDTDSGAKSRRNSDRMWSGQTTCPDPGPARCPAGLGNRRTASSPRYCGSMRAP